MPPETQDTEAKDVAHAIVHELGDWMLSEIGEDGLHDVIWDQHPPYRKWSKSKRAAFKERVRDEIYG